ncbi:MAG: prolipoprotein diacylglyceryl transferase [Oscillospiraceae bacterium]|nr:prolipoprotein diacylglyceryl transferase [Oscillospiraceae bacterium]
MAPYIYFKIPSYGLMAVIGIIVGVSILYYRSVKYEKYCLPFKDLLILCGICGACCVIGSRIVFILSQIPALIKDFSLEVLLGHIFLGGLVFYGGLLGAICGALIFSKIRKYNTNDVMDFVVPVFALFHGFGRIGCFMSGCCYGLKLNEQFVLGAIHLNYFPMQLVEALFEFIMFFILSKKISDGKVLSVYLAVYSIFRFINEFFRGDTVRGIWYVLSTSQIIALIILTVLAVNYVKNKISDKKSTD